MLTQCDKVAVCSWLSAVHLLLCNNCMWFFQISLFKVWYCSWSTKKASRSIEKNQKSFPVVLFTWCSSTLSKNLLRCALKTFLTVGFFYLMIKKYCWRGNEMVQGKTKTESFFHGFIVPRCTPVDIYVCGVTLTLYPQQASWETCLTTAEIESATLTNTMTALIWEKGRHDCAVQLKYIGVVLQKW